MDSHHTQGASLPRTIILFGLTIGLLLVAAAYWSFTASQSPLSLENQLQTTIAQQNIQPLDLGPTPDPAKVALGQALFFDKEISGNRNISCATCHHPDLAGADGRELPIGTGGKGLGDGRVMGKSRVLVPRNAPELFNRGSEEWVTMFWDGRVATTIYAEHPDQFDSPAETLLPEGLDSALAAQAMFPPTSDVEMRGVVGDVDVNGNDNEVAARDVVTMPGVWAALTERLMAIDEYQQLFATAYPGVSAENIGFEHAANAIAAFEIEAFSFDDSPWQLYLLGDDAALTREQKLGAQLFYGKANCSSCHAGNLMTDQAYHNIGVPQLGPGKNIIDGSDFGRYLETRLESDRFAFRTPPLANVALTAPYMHNGAYISLEDAVRHHLDARQALAQYDVLQLDPTLRDSTKLDDDSTDYLLDTLDPLMEDAVELSAEEFDQLMAFLNALTSPSAIDLSHLVPDSVPSGLPVAD